MFQASPTYILYPMTHIASARPQTYFDPDSLLHQYKNVMSLCWFTRQEPIKGLTFQPVQISCNARPIGCLSVWLMRCQYLTLENNND